MSGTGNHPINYETWYDAIRFANWLDNGQVAGMTETGAYTLLGGTPTPSNGNSIITCPKDRGVRNVTGSITKLPTHINANTGRRPTRSASGPKLR